MIWIVSYPWRRVLWTKDIRRCPISNCGVTKKFQ
jgi:hypothetical protein